MKGMRYMENLRICFKKARIFLLLAILAGSLMSIGDSRVVSAATRTVTAKKVDKGTKVILGDHVYKVTSVSKKKSTVSVVGLTARGKKRLTKVTIPKSIKIKSKRGKNKGTYPYKVTAIAKNAFKGLSTFCSIRFSASYFMFRSLIHLNLNFVQSYKYQSELGRGDTCL